MAIKDFARNIYSQNGEDGILEEVFRRLGIEKGKACEFGSADGYWMSNTRALMDKGWECVMLESSRGQHVTPTNVNELVPQDLDLLSIDIDGNDYACWEAYNGNARVVVIEINSSKDPATDDFAPDSGANYSIMKKLGEQKGYFLLCHTGNLVFVQKAYVRKFADKDITFDTQWL